MTGDALRKAVEIGVKGIVIGGSKTRVQWLPVARANVEIIEK